MLNFTNWLEIENIYPVHESYLSTISSETQFKKHIENTKFYDFDRW